MSKNTKARARKERRRKKAARKAMMRAKYEAWRDAGQNSKSKRFRSRLKHRSVGLVSHPDGRCGNIGCARCNPQPYNRLTPIQLARHRAESA